jgi:hypothetical protein
MTADVSVNAGLPKDVQKAEKFAPVRGSQGESRLTRSVALWGCKWRSCSQ